MPERFDISYIDKDNKSKRPVMLHRTIYGSLERFMGILLEHYNGHLPTWLAPIQVRIINYTDRNNNACEDLLNKLRLQDIRTDIDLASEPIGGKIKQAEMEKIPVILVLGDREEENKTIAVRRNGKVENIKRDLFIQQIKEEIDNKE